VYVMSRRPGTTESEDRGALSRGRAATSSSATPGSPRCAPRW
jgi:hypothetical protein